jgi:hypothetical protein
MGAAPAIGSQAVLFWKKRTKKLLLFWASGGFNTTVENE